MFAPAILLVVAMTAVAPTGAAPAAHSAGRPTVDRPPRAALPPPDLPYRPRVDPSDFVPGIDHPYLPLVPGTTWRYVERQGRRTSEVTTTVTRETRTILGVTCVVVHDVEKRGGRIVEDTRDWYAQDRAGNVWYFGEDTRAFRADGTSTTEGSWEAGVGGAEPGIALPAQLEPGPAYRQEYLAGEAEDMAQVIDTRATTTSSGIRYTSCVLTREWTPLERGSERKWYVRGVGLVRTESTDGEIGELVGKSR